MSEELPKIGEPQPTELSFSFAGSTDEVQIKFADGVRILPEVVVAELGVEKLKETAPGLSEVTYLQFMKAFNLTMEKRHLNRIGAQFIGTHFGNRF